MHTADDRFLKAVCIDKHCQAVLYISPTETILECYQCGQKYSKDLLQNIQEVSPDDVSGAVKKVFCRVLHYKNSPKRGTEMVKVLGLSNYYCKLLSPFLTRYGMDKSTGRAKLLTDMNQGEIFDCSLFGDRAFLIEPEHIAIAGFGKDVTGSLDYLSETLKIINTANGCEERLFPIHADGDGHCLVHAISRALVGRELFWHPLRCCLKKHFEANIEKYKELFKDFIDTDEWACIIEECDPNFQPPEGELHGLRNIHIFGLANVLRRPIILLDSLDCMQKCGDYSALFLPGFVNPDACRGKDNILNKPLCIAWSSHSHNHYIPLVGVQKLTLPVLPADLIPKVWGMPQNQIFSYIEFNDDGTCVIGGNRNLSNAYIQRLVHAMEELFYETHGVHPALVADYKLYKLPDNILFSAKVSIVLERAKTAVQEGRLYRCLYCKALCELRIEDWCSNSSAIYNHIYQNINRLQQDQVHFSLQGIYWKYDRLRDELVADLTRSELQNCQFCTSYCVRKVTNDGTIIFKAEDKDNPDKGIWFHNQARKIFPEDSYDQQSSKDLEPIKISVKLQWNDKEVEEEISYFDIQWDNEEKMNNFVEEESIKLIQEHFSGESSDSKLQAYVSEEIWKQMRKSGYSDLPSKSETKEEDCLKPEKTETISSNYAQPKLPSSELQYVKVVTSNANRSQQKTETISSNYAQPKLPSSELQYVKVVTSNANRSQQAKLSLTEEGVSYGQLQEFIRNEFNIPVENQRIKLGFPPKEILPTGDTNKQILPLRHGDRLTVEIHHREGNSDVEIHHREDNSDVLMNSLGSHRNSMEDISLPNASFTKFQTDVLWNILKNAPENFRRHGAIYKQIAESNKLHYKMHVNLDGFPDKVFCYNRLTDSIELCVKPLGHFLISADINVRIEQIRSGLHVLGFSKCPLMNKLEEMNDPHTFRTVASSHSSEESLRQPLLRKGPGFSVLTSPPDDMDSS